MISSVLDSLSKTDGFLELVFHDFFTAVDGTLKLEAASVRLWNTVMFVEIVISCFNQDLGLVTTYTSILLILSWLMLFLLLKNGEDMGDLL